MEDPEQPALDSVQGGTSLCECFLAQQGEIAMRLNKLFVLIVSLSGAAHAGENLLSDANFATTPVPSWTPVPLTLSNTLIANDGYTGAPSAEMTTSGSGSSGQGLYQCIPITPGTVYRLSAYI